jgi:outer membrane protein OmpA-like peptidoglycan-associated protein
MWRIVAALCVLAQLAGCAQNREWYVVMPEEGERPGSIVVTRDGTETVLEGAYSSIRSGDKAAFTADAAEVQKSFGAALEATPMRPASFMLFFVEGRDELTRESRAELDAVKREVASRPAPEVTVIGHADTTRSHSYNDALSVRRADRIRGELLKIGIPAERISIAGRGKRELLVPTPDNRREARNRRVEIEVR